MRAACLLASGRQRVWEITLPESITRCVSFVLASVSFRRVANGEQWEIATYGYAKQYSGVNLGSFVKHITSSNLTAEGLKNVGEAVMQLAKVEELEAHRRAVSIRLEHMNR